MIIHKIGNILECAERILVQQVNCMGVMGKGLALQIKNKWPAVYIDYMNMTHKYKDKALNKMLLGTYLASGTKDMSDKIVLNIFGQYDYNHMSGLSKCHTDYMALTSAFKKINEEYNGQEIAFPYRFGCGLAGGDWDYVQYLMVTCMPNINIVIYTRKEDIKV